jgi:putative addiction module component (TIGR02574 family)
VTDAQWEELDTRLEAMRQEPGAGDSWEAVKARIMAKRSPRAWRRRLP